MQDLKQISKSLDSDLKSLNIFLKKVTSTDVSLINNLSSHMIESGGKRIRPIILMLFSRLFKNKKNVIVAAAILELIHAATLLHDDVVDQSDIRHNIKTANKLWGDDSAVLVGDFLYSRAFELIVDINKEKVYKILAETTNQISQGEVIQLMVKDKIIDDTDKYLNIIYLKTGKLFEASAAVASELAGGLCVENAKSFGKNFGIAYQLRNDYLDYFGNESEIGKNIIEDLSEGKSTLPLIHSYLNSNSDDKKILLEIFEGKILTKSDVLLDIFKRNNSDVYTRDKIKEYSDAAIESLEMLSGESKQSLIDLTQFCSQRSK